MSKAKNQHSKPAKRAQTDPFFSLTTQGMSAIAKYTAAAHAAHGKAWADPDWVATRHGENQAPPRLSQIGFSADAEFAAERAIDKVVFARHGYDKAFLDWNRATKEVRAIFEKVKDQKAKSLMGLAAKCTFFALCLAADEFEASLGIDDAGAVLMDNIARNLTEIMRATGVKP